jgi:integrase
MDALMQEFKECHVANLSVRREFEWVIAKYFGPLKAYSIEAVTPLVVEKWYHNIGKHSQSQANKSLSILRTMFDKARDWKMYEGDNPCQRVKKYPRKERDRFVQEEEMPMLIKVLNTEPENWQCYFLLCLLVGCRKMEGLTIKWTDIDFHRGVWHKGETKTRIKHNIPIPTALLERIKNLPHHDEYVFASKRGHWSKSAAHLRWVSIRRAAGIKDVTIHDLRRTCASWLAIHGENIALISKGVLNHTTLANTGIYTRLNLAPVQKALEANSGRILGVQP